MLKKESEKTFFLIAIAFGVLARFVIMSFGHNFDFESYCIVGEIAGNFRSVYAETSRYNYGFIFFCIQGLLYRIAECNPTNVLLTYRLLIVSVLTMADLGIALVLADKKTWKTALIFFLNPISIFITGYHNQFDNIAILLALLSMYFYNEEERINKNDLIFILLIALSLITKHILFMLPVFLLLKRSLPLKKKVLYVFVPVIIFLLSFVPFAMVSNEAFSGILNNVFLYKSFNNAPLLRLIYRMIDFPNSLYIVVYGLLMCVTAFIVRKTNYEKMLMIYMIAMVSFSSAMANQYLAIPMAAICFVESGMWKYVYMLSMSVYLLLEEAGLGLINSPVIQQSEMMSTIGSVCIRGGYTLATLILLLIIIKICKGSKHNL